VKPPPFEYIAPRTTEEAVKALVEFGDGAKLIAGGQSLGPLLNFRLARPDALVDINTVGDAGRLDVSPDGRLRIGALARFTAVQRAAVTQQGWPILSDAISFVGHRAIRNRGTVCGSVAHADPAAEMPTIMCLLDARVAALGPSGVRTMSANGFFLSYFSTSLRADEMIVEVEVPRLAADSEYTWLEIAPRHGDFAIVGLGLRVSRDPDGSCVSARAVCAGIDAIPTDVPGLNENIAGARLTESVIISLSREAESAMALRAGRSASSLYRSRLVGVLLGRGLRKLAGREMS
jgi:aerobic carbon-monoxide dehydrogenase medium subunit